ncbi:MAG: hypothetical protein A2600_11525 [Candidatus Lambdaproteobacteria bacterium RIFOXYD1_FULL_56_27]|uniref:Bacterial surface antigen (D15) domain-containing protein n=1 Tax=Candidatus Lambdaproteobacteria bacterium RIFOXYD2_FULL_56_26 TaxID=1817773 RepID=A0A1F6H132_9PROT|nr:MAG: hypothetical protein A2557_11285 [Candidatus Lambdaproteobacteria bacterium RIFOXYD2_FULL_56_26]OGH08391.1 MAG: hypothetical protein A2600_11525 [Candidatus Lambdaproteobacteria bacterium RIFOXYD1_FULL_56_27]
MFQWPKTGLTLALLFCLTVQGFTAQGQFLVPERRRLFENRQENVYMVIPAVASLPGLGVFAGVLGSFSNIMGTGVDAAVTEARTFSGSSDIRVSAYALREVPLFVPGLTVEYWFGDIQFTDYFSYLPGRDSPNYLIPYTGKFKYYFFSPSYRLWERRIEINYNLVFFKGYSIDSSGQDTLQGAHSANGRLTLDLTDDWVDPAKGVRLSYSTSLTAPHSSPLGTDSSSSSALRSDLQTKSYHAGFYLPVYDRTTLALYQELSETWGKDAGNAQGFGGEARLRGYPAGRWTDRFAQTGIAEVRYTLPYNFEIESLLVHGHLDGVQLAAFAEQGQVSPTRDSSLWSNQHQSFGVGARLLIDAIILRLDLATADEGPQTHLTINHAF